MIQTKAVKSTAIASLKGNWTWAIIASLIMVCTFIASVIIQNAFSLITDGGFAILFPLILLVVFPVFLGSVRVFWKIANSEKQYVFDVFYYFSNKSEYKRAVKFAVVVILPLFITSTIAFLPSAVLIAISKGVFFESLRLSFPVIAMFCGFLGQLLGVAAFIYIMVVLFNYYTAVFLFTVNTEITPVECIKTSRTLAKFTRGIYVPHFFGYIGWILLSAFVLPLVFTLPYLLMSYVIDCRFCVSYYNRLKETANTAPLYEY